MTVTRARILDLFASQNDLDAYECDRQGSSGTMVVHTSLNPKPKCHYFGLSLNVDDLISALARLPNT
jgi:hypothetical protein